MSSESRTVAQDPAYTSLTIEKIRSEQNFPQAVIAGFFAAVAGAILWAAVTVATEIKLGLMAIAVGYLVGYAIKAAGKGIDQKFGMLGAFYGFLGCALGNVLSDLVFFAKAKNLPLAQLPDNLSPDLVIKIVSVSFQSMDLLFFAIGIYEGYKFSFKYRRASAVKPA